MNKPYQWLPSMPTKWAVALFFLCFTLYPVLLRAEVGDRQLIRVGAYHNPPKVMISETGKVTGFWPELLAHIAYYENWQIEYVRSDWGKALFNLADNKIDMMPDVAYTKQRAQLFSFANNPVLASWSRVYVRKGDTRIKSLEDLKGKKIAGLSGSVNVEGPGGIKKLVHSFNFKCQVLEFQSYNDVFQAVEDGFADAAITNRNFGDEYIKRHPVKKTPIMLSPVTLTFAFPTDGEKTNMLRSRIDYHISTMQNDSTSVYYTLLEKYFESNIAEKRIKVLPVWAKLLIVAFITGTIMLFLLVLYARRQVSRKTKELSELNAGLKEAIRIESEKRVDQEKIILEQKKQADMGRMIRSIAHQWRQPLNSIYIISQNLQEEWQSGLPYTPEASRQFDQQEELIEHMSATIDDFQNYFKPDREKTNFNIANCITKCLRLVSTEIIDSKIQLFFKCFSGEEECEFTNIVMVKECKCEKLFISGYEREFAQIIMNLLSNSIYAVQNSINHYKKISINIYEKEGCIYVELQDNGGGIDEEIISQVFEPYFTTKHEAQGTGIGLYMTKTILEEHMNGKISLENTPDGLKTTIVLKCANC